LIVIVKQPILKTEEKAGINGLTLSSPAVKTQSLKVPGVPAPCEKFPHTVDNF
jgi:hypothetical protein